jgi:hypothetical protein
MRATARDAGRDPGALEVTRWGSIDMTADDVAQEAPVDAAADRRGNRRRVILTLAAGRPAASLPGR